jgi:hypothetical protein
MVHLIAIAGYVQSHVVGVLLAIVASIAVGFVWHGVLFNKPWARMTNLGHLTDAQKRQGMIEGMAVSMVMAFLQAAVIGRALQILFLPNILHAFVIATAIWVPFTGMTMLNNYVWSRKPIAFFLIDAGYSLASLWAIAAVVYATL